MRERICFVYVDLVETRPLILTDNKLFYMYVDEKY